jgi:signal peptidase I
MNRWASEAEDPAGEQPSSVYKSAASPVGDPRIEPADAHVITPDERSILPRVVGRASVGGPITTPVAGGVPGQVSQGLPRGDRAVGRVSVPQPILDDPSLLIGGHEFVEGRPGHELADDLAEQRKRELPSTKDVERAQDERRWIMPMWQELPLLLVVAFCVAVLIRSFLVQAFVIPSSSMEQTLLIGDRVMVNKIVYGTRDPQRGEVVVFRGTDRWAPENFDEQPGGVLDRIGDTLGDLVGVSRPGEKDFIKRVIGVPGDRVRCCDNDGRVIVNGVAIDEPYLNSNSPLEPPPMKDSCSIRRFPELIVPAGELFVMGDHRGVSQDSRCQGTVPIDNVVGRAFFVAWPPSRWGGVGVPNNFSAVPAPSAMSSWRVPAPAGQTPVDPLSAAIAVTLLAGWGRRRTASGWIPGGGRQRGAERGRSVARTRTLRR